MYRSTTAATIFAAFTRHIAHCMPSSLGGSAELTNLEDDRHLGTVRDLSPKGTIDSFELNAFISDLYEVAEALKVPIRYSRPTVQDAENVEALLQVIRTGEFSISAESVKLNLNAEQLCIARDGLAAGNCLYLPVRTGPHFAQIFGQALDLGPYDVFMSFSALTPQETSSDDERTPVQVTLTKPMLYRFPRFLPNDNQVQSSSATTGG